MAAIGKRTQADAARAQEGVRHQGLPYLRPPYVEEVALSSSLALAPVASTAGSGARPNSA